MDLCGSKIACDMWHCCLAQFFHCEDYGNSCKLLSCTSMDICGSKVAHESLGQFVSISYSFSSLILAIPVTCYVERLSTSFPLRYYRTVISHNDNSFLSLLFSTKSKYILFAYLPSNFLAPGVIDS